MHAADSWARTVFGEKLVFLGFSPLLFSSDYIPEIALRQKEF
jgi:hypothetical protein